MLQKVQQITETPPTQAQRNTLETESPVPPTTFLGTERSLHMGAGLPLIPAKLVARIEAGVFVDMTELLPNKLGFSKTTLNDDQARPSKPRYRTVTNILEWTQCFATYMAVVCKKQPEHMPDLLGYMILIVEANMENDGEAWLGYDRRFRQRAASDQKTLWSQSDSTLWNLAFSGKAKANRCCYCFSLTYSPPPQCELAPDSQPTPSPKPLFANVSSPQHQP